jgi:hypothetical protein
MGNDFDSLAREVIRGLLEKQAPNGTRPEDCGRWADDVRTLYEAYELGGPQAVEAAFDALLQSNRALARLISGDPSPELAPQECPPLPDYVVLPEAGENTWLATYKGYAGAISPMTPNLFHEGSALWLASVAVARRLVVPMPFGDVYPNLFLALIAPTTLYRKTTGLTITRDLAARVLSHLLAAQDTTVESLLSDMAGREPTGFNQMSDAEREHWQKQLDFAAQRGWVLDEMSGLLSSAGKDYNRGLIEAILRFYDCDRQYTRSTRGQGRITVSNSYLALLGASTPGLMATHLASERLWAMGWWPRFAVLTPEVERPEWKVAVPTEEPSVLVGALQHLYDRLPKTKWPDQLEALTVSLTESAIEAWNAYNKSVSYDLLVTFDINERLKAAYGRLPTQAIKVATILAALDWPESQAAPIIDLSHLAGAIAICERWRASAHRALRMAIRGKSDTLHQRILQVVAQHEPDGITRRDLKKAIRGYAPERIDDAINQMLGIELREVDVKPGKNGGRPTQRLHLLNR